MFFEKSYFDQRNMDEVCKNLNVLLLVDEQVLLKRLLGLFFSG